MTTREGDLARCELAVDPHLIPCLSGPLSFTIRLTDDLSAHAGTFVFQSAGASDSDGVFATICAHIEDALGPGHSEREDPRFAKEWRYERANLLVAIWPT